MVGESRVYTETKYTVTENGAVAQTHYYLVTEISREEYLEFFRKEEEIGGD